MDHRIDAIFENGAFRPEVPVQLTEGQRVSLHVDSMPPGGEELRDIEDLLDLEYMELCRRQSVLTRSIDEIRAMLSSDKGSISDLIGEQREDR